MQIEVGFLQTSVSRTIRRQALCIAYLSVLCRENKRVLKTQICVTHPQCVKCKTKNAVFQYCLPGYYEKSHASDEILQTNSDCTLIHAVCLPILDYVSSSSTHS